MLTDIGGPDFPWALLEAEAPSLRGEVPLRTVLQDLAQTWTLTTSPDEFRLGLNTILHDPQSGASTLRAALTSYLPRFAG